MASPPSTTESGFSSLSGQNTLKRKKSDSELPFKDRLKTLFSPSYPPTSSGFSTAPSLSSQTTETDPGGSNLTNAGNKHSPSPSAWATISLQLPAQAQDLVRFRPKGYLYYGRPSKIQILTEASCLWRENIENPLNVDLHPLRAQNKDYSTGIEIELRMSGAAKRDAASITLSPTIWIRCESKKCRDKVGAAVAKLDWLCMYLTPEALRRYFPNSRPDNPHAKCFGLEIHVSILVLAASVAEASVPFENSPPLQDPFVLPSSHPSDDTAELYMHLEDDENYEDPDMACGRMLCLTLARSDREPVRLFSRLGGMISVAAGTSRASIFGLTAAHAIHNLLFSDPSGSAAADNVGAESELGPRSRRDDNHSTSMEDNSGPDSDSDSCCGSESSTSSAPDASPQPLGYKDPRKVKKWLSIKSTGPVNFLGRGTISMLAKSETWWPDLHIETNADPPFPLAMDADIAFLNVATSARLHNLYKGQENTAYIPVNHFPSDSDPGSYNSEVEILVSTTDPVEGYLLPGTSRISIGTGSTIETKKIELSTPLSEGTSGAWVVHGNALYGLIVAVCKQEPYAHMIAANQLYSNIAASVPGFQSVKLGYPNQAPPKQEANPPSPVEAPEADKHGHARVLGGLGRGHPNLSAGPPDDLGEDCTLAGSTLACSTLARSSHAPKEDWDRSDGNDRGYTDKGDAGFFVLGKGKHPQRRDSRHNEEDHDGDDHTGAEPGKYFACHFFKLNPHTYHRCGAKQLKTMDNVKQHLKRAHYSPGLHCRCCWTEFGNDMHALTKHAAVDCYQRQGPDSLYDEDLRLLQTERGASSKEKWYQIWRQICEGHPEPDSPYTELNGMDVYYEFFRRECRSKMMELLPSLCKRFEEKIKPELTFRIITSLEHEIFSHAGLPEPRYRRKFYPIQLERPQSPSEEPVPNEPKGDNPPPPSPVSFGDFLHPYFEQPQSLSEEPVPKKPKGDSHSPPMLSFKELLGMADGDCEDL